MNAHHFIGLKSLAHRLVDFVNGNVMLMSHELVFVFAIAIGDAYAPFTRRCCFWFFHVRNSLAAKRHAIRGT